MGTKVKHFVFLITCLFLACNKQVTQSLAIFPVHGIELYELKVLNLSENMSALSTGSDEIYLLSYLLKKNNTEIQILKEYTHRLNFDSTNTQYQLKDRLLVNDSGLEQLYLVCSLVELDEPDSKAFVKKQLEAFITTGAFFKSIDHLQVDSLIGYDDFLGLKFRSISAFQKKQEHEFQFKGLQLFDKYDYRLYIKSF